MTSLESEVEKKEGIVESDIFASLLPRNPSPAVMSESVTIAGSSW